MTLDTWLTIGFGAWGILASVVAFFAVTSDWVSDVLVRRGIKKLPKAFADCAEEYRNADSIGDNSTDAVARLPWDERVRRKDILAARLGGFALGRGIRRPVLAEGDNGYLVALAEVITAEPEQSDIPLLEKATRSKVPAHVNYRLMDAIAALARAGLVQPFDRKTILSALDRIEDQLSADGPWHKETVARFRAEVNSPSKN